ncbi:MAG: sugar transferase [Ruminococcaceae bacterium]|nr:sugar transferase [Oscillospiraceae bacterium]
MYAKCWKRVLDFLLSLIALLVLSPVLLILIIVGAIAMRGNPFFTQLRPGRISKKTGKEKIFRLIKFRTMDNRKDEHGNLLPDEVRLNRYGRLLRSTSLDELPELMNILKGDMSIVGPRPLLVKYLPRYSTEQRRRHEVRPGLTGHAQANGRNAISWEEKFRLDVEYIDCVTFEMDVKVIWQTVRLVLKREGIASETSVTMEEFIGNRSEAELIVSE